MNPALGAVLTQKDLEVRSIKSLFEMIQPSDFIVAASTNGSSRNAESQMILQCTSPLRAQDGHLVLRSLNH